MIMVVISSMSMGYYLKCLRNSKGISLKDLSEEVGVTDSILCRLENDQIPTNFSRIFRSLANYYGINVITLYLKSNSITQEDLNNFIFKNCDELTKEEIKHIQDEIDFINLQKNKYK